MSDAVRIQFVLLTLLALAGLSAAALRKSTIWSKPDADSSLNITFSSDGTLLALGRESSRFLINGGKHWTHAAAILVLARCVSSVLIEGLCF